MAKHIIGERYCESKKASLVAGIAIFVCILCIGIAGIVTLYWHYDSELHSYKMSPTVYTKPEFPLGWMLIIGFASLVLATLVLWLILRSGNNARSESKNVIIYNDVLEVLLVLSKREYTSIHLGRIVKVSASDTTLMPAVMPTGMVVPLALKTGYGRVCITFIYGSEKRKIKSDLVKNVSDVVSIIKTLAKM